MQEVSADKAYLSRDNLAFINQMGGVPFIPFKTNSIGRPKGAPPPAIQVNFNKGSSVGYDEQLFSDFTAQNYTSLSYTVTAIAQNGSDGYGPAYLLNGRRNSNYWYQLSIYYNWPGLTGGSGFYMEEEVWTSTTHSLPSLRVDFSGP